MMSIKNENIEIEVNKSTKWTILTELASKLISPVTGMILARLLSPEAFGIIATLLVVNSFAEMFADAGFQKYFIQHAFKNEEDEEQTYNVALYTTLFLAVAIWSGIFFFADTIAHMMGTPELVNAFRIMSFGVILNSISGMEMAIFKRHFQFDLLFRLRMVTVFIPLVITIPLALLGLDYWALIIGTLISQLASCIFQYVYSPFQWHLFYSFSLLKKMLSFSLWSLFEAVTIWFSSWGRSLIVGTLLSTYYLGLYRGADTLVASIFSIVSTPFIQVIYSGLSRLQNDIEAFNSLFYKQQKRVAFFVFPLGVGIFVYSDVVVQIVYGSQWHEIDFFVGLLGLVQCISIIINSFASEALRAKGMPFMSSLSQICYIVLLWPAMYYFAHVSFKALVISNMVCVVWLNIVKMAMMKYILKMSIKHMAYISCPIAIATAGSGLIALVLRKNMPVGIIYVATSALIFMISYVIIISRWTEYRQLVKLYSDKILIKIGK